MNIHDMQHDRAAAPQIIKALALPALSRASEPPRPMPLSHLPRLPRETRVLRPVRSALICQSRAAAAVSWEASLEVFGLRLAKCRLVTPSASGADAG